MPLIAIAPGSRLADYEEAVRRAGGQPWVLNRETDTVDDVVGRADGVLLSGGEDVLPSIYGAPEHPSFKPAESGRDEYEIALARRASDADLPLLAICRGVQVLNVARGGTLVQDIASELPEAGAHTLSAPPHNPVEFAHPIWVTGGSLLDRLLGERLAQSEELPVNSRHHQALKDIGAGLTVTATAPDGVIEAVEDPSRRFLLGVQWHPENFWRTGEFSALFEGFVKAASR